LARLTAWSFPPTTASGVSMEWNVFSHSSLAVASARVRCSTRASSAWLSARSSSFWRRVSAASRSFSVSRSACSKALWTVSSSAWSFQGLAMKRKISDVLIASSIAFWSACPVSMIRCVRGDSSFTRVRSSTPLIPGIRKSEMTTDGRKEARSSRPRAPSWAISISQFPPPEGPPQRPEDVLLVVDQQQPPAWGDSRSRGGCHLDGFHDGQPLTQGRPHPVQSDRQVIHPR